LKVGDSIGGLYKRPTSDGKEEWFLSESKQIKRGYRQFLELHNDNEFVMPVCCNCCVDMVFKQIYAQDGTTVKGLKIICPLCGHEE